MWKSFRKITIGNVKKCQILNNFLLPPVEISFFNRVYLRNGAFWTPQTLNGQDSNFRSSMQIRCQNFKIRFNKKVRNLFLNFLNFSALKSRLGLAMSYQGMWKEFRKITIGNVKKCKILKIFVLPTVQISFFNRL